MALIQRSELFVLVASRQSSFTDEDGKKRTFHYVTGFNPVNDSVYVDLTLLESEENVPFVGFDFAEANSVYECEYSTKSSKNLANSSQVTSICLKKKVGVIELKMDKK